MPGRISPPDIADCLYTGIVTDTGQFSFDYTRPESLQDCRPPHGVRRGFEDICARVFRSRTLSKTRLIASALSGLRLYGDGRVAVTSVSQAVLGETNATPDECESIVNYTVEIEGVEVGVLLRETQSGDWKVSLRASGGVDVAKAGTELWRRRPCEGLRLHVDRHIGRSREENCGRGAGRDSHFMNGFINF